MEGGGFSPLAFVFSGFAARPFQRFCWILLEIMKDMLGEVFYRGHGFCFCHAKRLLGE